MPTSDRPNTLWVWRDGTPIAELSDQGGVGVQGRYRPEALDAHPINTPLLSCSLPLRGGTFDATAFFDGTLPEGTFRAELAARARVTAQDTFGLLARYGRDILGALVVADPVQGRPGETGGVLELDDDDLAEEVAQLPERPLGIHDDSELSLPGLQDKMLLVALGGGRWGRPLGGKPSTHILKLDHRVHRGVVAAEADGLALARACGLTSVDTEIRTFAGIDSLIVSRFDRAVLPGGDVVRVHQEDSCQALGRPPTTKYELRHGGGGPEVEEVARLLDTYAADPLTELDRLAAVATFTALIGNADAHGKNVSFLHPGPGEIRLAPLYDTVPTVLWPKLTAEAAMTIGGLVNLEKVDQEAVAREARRWRHSPTRAVSAARTVAAELLVAVDTSIDSDGPLAKVVRSRAERFLR